ncbi:MAG: type I methionyl aminopeptidase [Deltaproteobacteria bacterium]|jgi:methionyl aminopeptidase|nr:type I methionyl aminopeptidase [Deltaproteobacteria bacterium]
MIHIKSPTEIEMIRRSGRLASETLDYVGSILREGLTTKEIDRLVHRFILDHKAVPATLGYKGFPGSCCVSINEEVVHAIPGSRTVKKGDVVKVDVTTILNGYYGDTTRTFLMEPVSDLARRLTMATKMAIDLAIETVRPGSRVGDIGAAIQGCVEKEGFSVVQEFVGHGVGVGFHEPPNIPHYGRAGTGVRLKKGMVFTIEPMINAGDWRVRILADGWTAVTSDGQLSAQFEHTLAVTADGCEVLTLSPAEREERARRAESPEALDLKTAKP